MTQDTVGHPESAGSGSAGSQPGSSGSAATATDQAATATPHGGAVVRQRWRA